MSLKSETKCERSKAKSRMTSERTNKRHLRSTLILHPQVYFSQYMKGNLRIIKTLSPLHNDIHSEGPLLYNFPTNKFIVVVQPLPVYKGHHPALEVDIVESFDLF